MTRLLSAAAFALTLGACQTEPPPAQAAPPEPAAEVTDVATVPVVADGQLVTVYKSPTCGCCTLWAEHLRESGFRVEEVDRTDMGAVKDSLGVPRDLSSCHTGTVEGYVVEGHVPAAQVARMLEERPDARGLSVPGMPIGSPGMEVGDRRDAYDVLIVDESGEASVYEHVPGSEG